MNSFIHLLMTGIISMSLISCQGADNYYQSALASETAGETQVSNLEENAQLNHLEKIQRTNEDGSTNADGTPTRYPERPTDPDGNPQHPIDPQRPTDPDSNPQHPIDPQRPKDPDGNPQQPIDPQRPTDPTNNPTPPKKPQPMCNLFGDLYTAQLTREPSTVLVSVIGQQDSEIWQLSRVLGAVEIVSLEEYQALEEEHAEPILKRYPERSSLEISFGAGIHPALRCERLCRASYTRARVMTCGPLVQ